MPSTTIDFSGIDSDGHQDSNVLSSRQVQKISLAKCNIREHRGLDKMSGSESYFQIKLKKDAPAADSFCIEPSLDCLMLKVFVRRR